ncbi:MAG TPA: flagellar basal body rod protein FlgC [Bryobacteraceae bacterium]|jgi:flagellar basal-body rod protein FlgC|nr:flagellar basal body rod protein FlgC [Bryobacteraceae bacterium]
MSSLFGAISVSASGMSAERTRAEVLVENIANANTTRTAEGGPYRRRDVVFETQPVEGSFSSLLSANMGQGSANGVGVGDIVQDTSEPDRRYMPGHPDADKDGYVAFPKINPAEDMVDLLGASRSYQANVSAISAVKDMIQRSIDLFR